MHLDRCVATNRCIVAIYLNLYKMINGILGCLFIWLINYLSIIKVIFDIASRAVNAYRDKFPPPQLEQINTTIEHNRISLFDNVSYNEVGNVTIAIVSQNASSAVRFLVCRILDSEVIYAK
jgi:hypothetical protein